MYDNKTVLELGIGVSITDAADLAIKLAQQRKSDIILEYNNVNIKVSPNTSQRYVINAFFSQAMTKSDLAMDTQKTM